MSLGRYEKYDEAQQAVDYLSDHEFPVQNVLIVGTDLKQLERVTGRLTRGRVAGGGALSGDVAGLFVGLIFSLFDRQPWAARERSSRRWPSAPCSALVWALIGYAGHRRPARLHLGQPGRRHAVRGARGAQAAQRARELLAQMDPAAAAHGRGAGRLSARPLPSRRSSSLPPTPDVQCLPGMGPGRHGERASSGASRGPRASAIQASTSADVRGMAAERFSQPSAVTTTSSSIRTPMPRNRSGGRAGRRP